jgi:hypothetical protein
MSLVVIGGHSRSVGKTSVVAGLISALPEFEWTAAKITQYGHGICSANGEACDCATGDHSWAFTEERDRTGESDTSRFLAAGAGRVFWVRTEQGRLAEAMPTLRDRLKSARNVIIESNSVMKFLRPDLYLTILDQEIRTRISRPRGCCNPAPVWQRSVVAIGLPETGCGLSGFPDSATELRDSAASGVCTREDKQCSGPN